MLILITGDRKGIGRHLSEYYLEKGHFVIGCSRSETDLVHENYKHFQANVSNEEDITNIFKYIRKEHKTLDILINNAGIASMNHFLLTPVKTVRKVMEVNYIGTAAMCNKMARLMFKSENPRIINFTTVARALNLDGEAIYAASKAAVETLTKILAKELSPYSITVNAIGPTAIKTDLIKNISEKKMQELLDKQSIKQFGTFEDVVNLVDFYIKPESKMITGQVIYLGGVS